MKSRFAFSVLLTVLLCACAAQEDRLPNSSEIESTGMLALQAHQPAAIDTLERWAYRGLPVAQRELGLVRAQTPLTQAQAVTWLQMAAKGGDAKAQFHLAKALHEGRLGLPQDFAQAWVWFEAAAKQNDRQASFMLARMAKYGQGVAASPELSVYWLQESSQQGNPQAMFLLSNAYAEGDGVSRNTMLARHWLTKSADGDYGVAIQALALELDGLGGPDTVFAKHSRDLLKEAKDHRLMRWNGYQ
jgi:TPR repeat protein